MNSRIIVFMAWRKFLAEMIGTFALVFAGTGAIIINDVIPGSVSHVGIALTFGLVILAMIYAVGDISGAHFNPAVSLGFLMAGKLPVQNAFFYIISQIVGAFLASVSLLLMFGNHAHLGATLPAFSAWQSFGLEAILTGILMFVILCVSQGSKEVGTMAGIAIGGVIGLEAMFAGPISGASMNPARSLAPAVMSGTFQALWVYMSAPVLGALAAVPFWQMTRNRSRAHTSTK